MFWANTSRPQFTSVSIDENNPLKSGVRASTAVPGFNFFISSTVSAKCCAPPSGRSSLLTEVKTTYLSFID